METNELITGYIDVIKKAQRDLSKWEEKAEALIVLSDKIAQIRDDVDREILLDLRIDIDDLKKASARCDKLVKACIKWVDDAILLRLQEDKLDNYSYNGKIYFPSTTVYPSVADRNALEAAIAEGVIGIDALGNTLNKEVLNTYLEKNGELPPGVNSHEKMRLNCRTK